MAKYLSLKEEYDILEHKVYRALKVLIAESSIISKNANTKAIKVNIYDYTELVVINDTLTFLDKNGFHYSIDSDCTLTDLIDIISAN